MRKIFLLVIVVSATGSYAQTDADLIIGKWLKTSKEDLIIEVYKSNNEYKGKVAWTKAPDSVKLIGYQILEGLKYNEKRKIWTDGKIRNPKSGSSYSATAKIRADGTLEVLAYKGLKFIGRKKYFKRVK